MKCSLAAPLLGTLGLALAACQAPPHHIEDHWNERSVMPRISRYFLGYDASRDGDYIDFQWRRKQDLNLLVRRYFFNDNPDNPHHPDVPSRYEARPNHSLLPNPIPYWHWEGLILGLPVDSILGTISSDKGWGEFWNGVGETARPLGIVTTTFLNTWVAPPINGTVTRFNDIVN